MTLIFLKKKSIWVLNTCESRHQNFKAEQLSVADDRRGLEMGESARHGSWSGVPWSHPHFVLEFSLISVVSVCWGNERKKERKNTEKEMGSERKWRKERKKKVVKLKEKKHLPLKTKTFLPYSGVAFKRRTKFLKQVLPVTQQFLKEKKMLSSCGYMVKKEPHNKLLLFL